MGTSMDHFVSFQEVPLLPLIFFRPTLMAIRLPLCIQNA